MFSVTTRSIKNRAKPRANAAGASCRCRGVLRVTVFILILIGGGVSRAPAQTEAVPEYELKAAVLCKILNFIEWPPQSFKNEDRRLGLCIFGSDPFGPQLDSSRVLQIGGRQLEIRRSASPEGLDPCRAVFISAPGGEDAADVLQRAESAGILTIGDTEGFCRRGGMVNLVLKQSRISFEINVKAAEKAGLKISSKLLRLATIVETQR